MVKEREKRGVDPKFRSKQIEVPIGTDISTSPISFNKIDRNKIVFTGHLREGHGIEMLISAMEKVTKRIPNAHLLIVGGGPLETKLESQVKKLKLGGKIKFSGFVEDFVNVKNLIKDAAIAVAPYVDDEKTYTRYTDPGKPKDYMSCGLPVIITKVPQIALIINKERCGIAIDYDEDELVEALEKLLRDDRLLLEYRQNAFEMAKKYTWEKVFNKAFKDTL